MRFRLLRASSIAVFVLALEMFLGCQGSEGTVEVGFISSGQALTATNADAGATPGPHLILTISRVDVHVAGEGESDDDHPGTPTGSGSSINGTGWVTVFSGAAHVDLLDTKAVEAFLGSAATPSGKITQIRLILADATWIDGAQTAPVTCPSCSQTGLKIVTMGKLVVPAGGVLHVTLALDREHSINAASDGVRLDPVVKIAGAQAR
jgi:hypothetical protein